MLEWHLSIPHPRRAKASTSLAMSMFGAKKLLKTLPNFWISPVQSPKGIQYIVNVEKLKVKPTLVRNNNLLCMTCWGPHILPDCPSWQLPSGGTLRSSEGSQRSEREVTLAPANLRPYGRFVSRWPNSHGCWNAAMLISYSFSPIIVLIPGHGWREREGVKISCFPI